MRKLLLLLLAAPAIAFAQKPFVARCSEPTGTRYDQIEGKMQLQADGFTGVNPMFIVTADSPRKLTYLWGPAAWAKDALKLRENLMDAAIVDWSPEKITAIRVEPFGVTQMYSLYPTKGLVYFTQHRMIMDGIPNTSTFYARCEFTN